MSTEELTLSINLLLSKVDHKAPASWWDRSCDIALLLGTFVHGLGNYEAMLNDETLPFISKISKYARTDLLCCDAQKRFTNVATVTKKVCDNALDASKLKAQKEVQKAVAAAAAASLKREKEAAALREGGIAADAVISNMGEQPMDHLYEIQEGKDDHFITLPRLKQAIELSVQSSTSSAMLVDGKVDGTTGSITQKEIKGAEESKGRRKRNAFQTLPMPDARVLNFRLKLLIAEVERHYADVSEEPVSGEYVMPKVWPASDTVLLNQRVRDSVVRFALESKSVQTSEQIIEYAGIGLNGTQCGVMHRSVDDRTDFSIGAASQELYQVAHGPESPRYLRALGVPMTFGRFGLIALVYADEKCVHNMLDNEHKRCYENGKKMKVSNIKEETVVETDILSDDMNRVVESGQTQTLETKIEFADGKTDRKSFSNNAVPSPFLENTTLRAGVTCMLLYYGYPFIGDGDIGTCCDIWKIVRESCPQLADISSTPLFGVLHFESLLRNFCKNADVPKTNVIKEYIDECFLPHCLKLCLYGNNATTQITRGSKGEYETPDGISSYPEPSGTLQSPLPDPCLPLSEQSIEAVGAASAILRRVRMMRCILAISGGRIPANRLKEVLRSRTMRKSMDGLPIWWCPWIHDAALLAHAGTRGLFSVFRDLESESGSEAGPVFSPEAIRQHIESSFFAKAGSIPPSITEASSQDDTATWIENQAKEFPSPNVVERRLAFLCAKVTENLENESRFDNLPMYDHGGWPRN